MNFYILKLPFLVHDQVLWCISVSCSLSNTFLKWRNLVYFYFIASEKYEPVYAKWTTERCAICRWVEDWEDNKIIICNRCYNHRHDFHPQVVKLLQIFWNSLSDLQNFKGSKMNYFTCIKSAKLQFICRCQVAVHQECYGAKNVQDFTSWVCRVCETPDVERECCLCPVKGMSSTFNLFFGLTVFAVLLHYIKFFRK